MRRASGGRPLRAHGGAPSAGYLPGYTVSPPFVGRLKAIVVEGRNPDPRYYDAEAKLFAYLRGVLPRGASGKIQIWVEFPQCMSCKHVQQQFQEDVPGIVVEVLDGIAY